VTGAELRASDVEAQLHQPRLAEVVAGILRARIVDGQLPDGSRLPKQDELLREFRVSRPSLREALRILEAEGLLTVQRGNVGGAIVRAPSAQTSAYMFGLVLQSRQVELVDQAEALRNVEPVAAALCARRADRGQTFLPRVRAAHAAAEAALADGVDFTRTARRFHEEFVGGCGNNTLIVMLGSLELMWSHQERQWAERAEEDGRYPSRAARQAVLDAHAGILDAIERGDADDAARRAGGHLRESQRFTLTEGGERIVQAAPMQGPALSL
jgi:DNA-binding FadR family transcriptional regulator